MLKYERGAAELLNIRMHLEAHERKLLKVQLSFPVSDYLKSC